MAFYRPWMDEDCTDADAESHDLEDEIVDIENCMEDDDVDDTQDDGHDYGLNIGEKRKRWCSTAKTLIRKCYSNLVLRNCPYPFKETSLLLDVPTSTVRKYVNCREDIKSVKRTKTNRIASAYQNPIKDVVYSFYKKNEVPTVEAIAKALPSRGVPDYDLKTIWEVLYEIGFRYGHIDQRRHILNTPRLIEHRIRYIDQVREYRNQGRRIVYLDETWYDTHDVRKKGWMDTSGKCFLRAPCSRGQRIIILNAGCENGWIKDCLLLSAKNIKKCAADYHEDMTSELFEKWFKNQLLPNLEPGSVIVMDNASYHSRQLVKIPNKSTKKCDIIDFMNLKGVPLPEKQTKVELLKVISKCDVKVSYVIDTLAEEMGFKVLRLPPYYCVLNPIELVWSSLKRRVRKLNKTPNLNASLVAVIKEVATNYITPTIWSNCVQHVIKKETELNKCSEIDKSNSLIITINGISDTDDSSDGEL